MNRKLPQLLQPSLQLYFICLVLFALASAMFTLPLAVLELAVVVLLALHHRSGLHKRRLRFAQTVATLDAISPLRVLARGYAVATKGKRGAVVTDAAALGEGDTLHIRFAKGAANCRVTDTEEEA